MDKNDKKYEYKQQTSIKMINDDIAKAQREYQQNVDDAIFQTIYRAADGEYSEIVINKDKVVKALANAKPQQVIRKGDQLPYTYHCPSCKGDLIPTNNYCPTCGQRLKWRGKYAV